MNGHAARPRFLELQYAFAAHIRDPAAHPVPPGIEDRRMAIYRELFYNNVEGLLAGNFPVIRRTLADAHWHRLVRAFFAGHRCHTPLFSEIGREFLRFLEARDPGSTDDPPWLYELAHYEWVELALQIDETVLEAVAADPAGDVVANPVVLSPVAWPLVYRFAVHRIGPGHTPTEAPAQPTCLVVFRNRADRVSFIEASPLAIRLLELVKENPDATGLDCVNAIADSFPASDRETVVAAGADLLRKLRDREVLLGTRVAPAR